MILDQHGRTYRFQEPERPETDEVASHRKDIDIFAGWTDRLDNPDPVLLTESRGKGLRLYDEVARDAHAASVIQTRILSVVGKEWQIEPASDSGTDQEIASFTEKVLYGCNYDQARQELLKAILYGFYAGEVMWGLSQIDGRSAIVVRRILAKHPKRFLFTPERELRLMTPDNQWDGERVPDRKFIVFTFGSSDNPYGEGLGQKLWWPVWFKKNGIKFWLVFLEKFGSPTLLGKYPAGTHPDKQQALLDAIDAVQQETGIKIPDSMSIDLLEASRQGKASYGEMCEYMDKQISKIVLGQTATTEGTPGKLGNEQAQENVRDDITKADADLLCECLNGSLVKWSVDYNFPGVTAYPKIWIRTEAEQDLKELADRDKIILADLGMGARVPESYISNTYGIPLAEEGEPTIKAPEKQPAAPSVLPSPGPGDTGTEFAEGSGIEDGIDSLVSAQAEADRIADEAVREGSGIVSGWLSQVKGFLAGASSLETARDSIAGLYDVLDSSAMAGSLARGLMEADRLGAESVPGSVSTGGEFAEARWGPGLPFEEAIDFFRAKAFTIAGVAKADLLGEVKDEIIRSMETGSTLRDFRNRFDAIFEARGYGALPAHRVDTIYRTNMQSAYQAGRYRQMTSAAVAAARPYWRYVAVMDASTRPEHAAMNGRIFRNDNPIWHTWYPPNGFNCRCFVQTLSEREIRRNGWTVEDEDLSGKTVEWVDPNTGEVMQVALAPDEGFGGRPPRLETLIDDRRARGGLADVAWKERPGQPGPKDLGRLPEKKIPAPYWKTSPGRTPRLADLMSDRRISKSQALVDIENEYRRAMGISPNETMGVLRGPDGEIVNVTLTSLAHAMLKTGEGRERYLRYFRDVIEDPYEILLTEYEAGIRGKTKLRKKYIGLYVDEAKEAVMIVAEISPEGWVMWNVMKARRGTVDRLRRGVELLYGKD